MELTVTPDGDGRFLIRCPEEMTWDVRLDLVSALRTATGDVAFHSVIIDMDNVVKINSAGIGAMFALWKYALQSRVRLAVARPRPAIARLLATVNLAGLVPLTETLDEARAMLEGAPHHDKHALSH